MVSGSNIPNSMKDGSRSKMINGSKDSCGDTTGKKNQENGKIKKQRDHFHRVTKKHDQYTLVKESKKWYEGWKQENLTTKTELELC